MSFRRDKRGVIGSFITTFVATVAIVLILVIFSLGAGVVKSLGGGTQDGLKVPSEGDVGIGSLNDYIVSFVRVVRLRTLVESDGKEFVVAFDEAKKLAINLDDGLRSLRFKYIGAEIDGK